jgi:hypothetical protein
MKMKTPTFLRLRRRIKSRTWRILGRETGVAHRDWEQMGFREQKWIGPDKTAMQHKMRL